jgi:hypothetical protein
MKNNIFKFSIIFEIILSVATVIYFFLNPFWKNVEFLKIKTIHPNEFFYGYKLNLICLIVSFFTAAIISFLFSDSTKIENNDAISKKIKDKNLLYWKYMFFINLLLSVALFILSYHLKQGIPSIIIFKINYFLHSVLIMFFGTIILSFIIGCLFVGTKTFLNQNKLVSFIFFAIGVGFFVAPYYLIEEIQLDFERESYYRTSMNDVPAAIVKDYSDAETTPTVYDWSEDESPFSHLWSNPDYDSQIVDEVAGKFFESFIKDENTNTISRIRERYSIGQYKDMDVFRSETVEGNFDKMVSYMSRDAKIIEASFDKFKDLIYKYVSYENYNDTNIRKITELLLESHENLYSVENYNKNLRKIFNKMNDKKTNSYDISDNYQDILPFISQKIKDHLKASEYVDPDPSKYEYPGPDNIDRKDIVWAYSFWARRNQEKNEDVVFKILTEINDHYTETGGE